MPVMSRSTVHMVSIFAVCAAHANAGDWQPQPPLPEPNGGFVCAEWQGRIFVLGGTNWAGEEKQWLAGVHLFDPVGQSWSSQGLLAQPLAHAMVGSTASGLVVAGGTTGAAPYRGQLRLENGQVKDEGPGMGAPAVASAGGLIGDEMIVVGGTDDVADVAGLRREAFAWNIHTGETRALPPYPGGPVGIAAAVVVGDELLVFGGAAWDPASRQVINLSEAQAFSAGRNTWRRLQSLPCAVRALAAVPLDTDRIYLAGGVQTDADGFTDQALIYHIAEDRYSPAVALPYRAYVGLVQSGGFVYCLGGEDKARHRTDSVYRIRVSELIR